VPLDRTVHGSARNQASARAETSAPGPAAQLRHSQPLAK
jgi:hypothetical protein